MRCCTIKLKRRWRYCPSCGEEIEWPQPLPPPKQWPPSVLAAMVGQYGVPLTVNILQSREVEILAGRVNGTGS